MDNIDNGLFLVNNLNPAGVSKVKQAYCRIGEISLQTGGGVVYNRLVMYKVHYWDYQPQTEDDCAQFKLYKEQNTGYSVFVTSVALDAITLDALQSACIQHFLAFVLNGKRLQQVGVALEKLASGITALWPFVDGQGESLAVSHVVHKAYYSSEAGQALQEAYSRLTYRGHLLDDDQNLADPADWEARDPVAVDEAFEHYTLLIPHAITHWRNPTHRAEYGAAPSDSADATSTDSEDTDHGA